MCKYSRIIRDLHKRVIELENQLANQNFITTEDLNENRVIVTANQPFPNSWNIEGTLDQLISDINSDIEATKGRIYLSTVYLSDLPSEMGLAEMKVEILLSNVNNGKVILFTITSENVSPYHWEATSAYGRSATWRSFIPN